MKTSPTVSRFVDREHIGVQPETRAKADDEGDSYEFFRISTGHYACITKTTTKTGTSDNTYIIIEKDGKIGCSCPDMTYRGVCKHAVKFVDLPTPPQTPASEEIMRKLMIMGWVGGKDNLHPAEPVSATSEEHMDNVAPTPPIEAPANTEPKRVNYVCPKCGEKITTEETKLRAWKLNHMDVCPGNKKVVDPLHEPEDPNYPDMPEMPEPPDEDYSNCRNVEPRGGLLSGNALILDPTELNPETVAPDPAREAESVDQPVPPNLATAMCNMQKIDLLARTDSKNPFHNAKYADLASVWSAIRKPLTDNGLAVIQTTEPYPDGITVVTTLMHTSGEVFTARLSYEVPQSKPDKNGHIKPNIQGLGSTITYLRRYSLIAMVGVAPVDDDGEAAMNR